MQRNLYNLDFKISPFGYYGTKHFTTYIDYNALIYSNTIPCAITDANYQINPYNIYINSRHKSKCESHCSCNVLLYQSVLVILNAQTLERYLEK